MIKKVREKTKGWQIHKQLIVLILLTGMVSVLLFEVLWLNKWNIYEYTLVFEEGEEPKVKEIPIKFFRDCINEHSDFIHLAGFQTEMEYTYVERWITGDKGMIKRILSNLFSNILKYGDKSSPVFIKGSFTKQSYTLEISNTVKQQNIGVESNHIGLMSVEKMMHQLGGESTFSEKNGSFSVELKFSLVH